MLLELEPGVPEMVMATAGYEPTSAGSVQRAGLFQPPYPTARKSLQLLSFVYLNAKQGTV